jgi:hypothetical protein
LPHGLALRSLCRPLAARLRLFGESDRDGGVVKWQRRIEPVWKRIAGGCHLTRPVSSTIEAAGFRLETCATMYLPNTPHWAGWNEWGSAAPA